VTLSGGQLMPIILVVERMIVVGIILVQMIVDASAISLIAQKRIGL
jgi:hypothetical protein